MNANPKPGLYKQLKEAGLPLSRTYAQYTVEQLRSELDAEGMAFTETEEAAPAGFFGLESPEPEESRPTETPEEVGTGTQGTNWSGRSRGTTRSTAQHSQAR